MNKTNPAETMMPEATLDLYKRKVLNILVDFDSFLSAKGIKYSLGGGTLLGAIRHSGYIPWDDDIDIILEKNEFDRLVDCVKEFSSDKYDVILPFEDTPLANPRLIKIYDKHTCIKEYGNRSFCGAFIDVFSTMNLKECNYSKQLKKYRAYTVMLMIKNKRIDYDNPPTKSVKLLRILAFFYSKERLKKKIRYFYSQNNDTGVCFSSFGLDNSYRREWFNDFITHEFENRVFPIIKEFDTMLKIAYGDYMKLPPIDERVPNHLEFCDFEKSYEDENKRL